MNNTCMNTSCPDAFEVELINTMGLRDASPQFVQSLRQKVLNAPKPGYWHRPLVGKFAVALSLIMTITFFMAGPQNVLAAVRQWLGQYFPGIGFVEDSDALRILESPAAARIEGAEVTVEWAYTNDEQTVMAYPEENDTRLCADWLVYSPETHQQIEDITLGKIRLPDGRILEWDFNGGYPPIPAGIDEAALIFYTSKEVPDCPETASCRCMDEDQRVEVPLRFVTPPPGTSLEIYEMQFTPVAPASSAGSGK